MEQIDQLSVALNKAQSEMKAAKKDSDNPFFKSKYADLGSVWEACHAALTGNGLSVAQRGNYRDGHFFLTTTLIHKSGQSISGDYLIKPVKDDPQAYGSAWTYARRYSLAAMVGVISEDDDANAASQESQATAKTQAVKNAAPLKSDIEIVSFVPVEVTSKDGTGKNGKPYTNYVVKSAGGEKFSTLDKTSGEIAIAAYESGKTVKIGYQRNGQYLNIKKIKFDEVPDSQPDPEPVIEEAMFQ